MYEKHLYVIQLKAVKPVYNDDPTHSLVLKKPLRTNIFQISVTGHNGVYALDPKVE